MAARRSAVAGLLAAGAVVGLLASRSGTEPNTPDTGTGTTGSTGTTEVEVIFVRAEEPSPALWKSSPHGVSYEVENGALYTIAQHNLRNTSSSPITLHNVGLIDGAPGLELVGTMVSGPDRAKLITYVGVPGWPPVLDQEDEFEAGLVGPSGFQPVDGFVMAGGDGMNSPGALPLFGIRLAEGVDRATSVALSVECTFEGRRYLEHLPSTITVCPAAVWAAGRCDGEYCGYGDYDDS